MANRSPQTQIAGSRSWAFPQANIQKDGRQPGHDPKVIDELAVTREPTSGGNRSEIKSGQYRRQIVRILNVLWLATLLSLQNPSASANAGGCKEAHFGKCYEVHGRYAIYVEGDAIWPVGTHRLLSTTNPELDKMLQQSGWEDHAIFGDFSVCPTSLYKRGEMQSVCIQSYRNLRINKRK